MTMSKGVEKSAQVRKDRTINALQAAMAKIGAEVAASKGIYLLNGGRVSMAEVCRRAGVHPITLQGAAHRETRRRVQLWIRQLSSRLVTGSQNIRTSVTSRAESAEDQVRKLAARFQSMYQVELPRRDAEIEELRARVAELEAENLKLVEQISQGLITRIRR